MKRTAVLVAGLSLWTLCPRLQAVVPVYHQTKMEVANKVHAQVYSFELSDVRLLAGPFKHAQDLDAAYLLRIEPDRLLSRFRVNAGLKPKGESYGGWESQGISGHTLGHYLSACSLMYASTGDTRFKERVRYIVSELAACQKAGGDGFIGGMPNAREIFAKVAAGAISSAGFDLNGSWVPWYNEHKTFAGLIDAYLYTGSDEAKQVLVRLADWAWNTTKGLSDDEWQKMLAAEHGGMNDSLADVYALTGDPKYLDLSRKFYHRAVLDPLANREDRLTGLHANTQIPKVIGAARLYELTGEQKYDTIASFFWDVVTKERSYVIGGNSNNEHFPPKEAMSKNIGPSTAETCNTYNMLKLTRHLFSWNPLPQYADYYERALYNHILASQDPDDGMMCYYVPLKTGVPKAFNTPFDSFWCCTGTGMENHAKYGDSIYFRSAANDLYVNLFIASELRWTDKGVTVRQNTEYPVKPSTRLTLTCRKPTELALHLRRPLWAVKSYTVTVNGARELLRSKPGSYVTIKRVWKSGDVIEISMPMTLREEPMRDDAHTVALLYGPLVLAAAENPAGPPPVIVAGSTSATTAIKPVPGKPLTFTASGRVFRVAGEPSKKPLTLRPFYAVYKTPYVVYWDSFTEGQWNAKQQEYLAEQARARALEARTTDSIRVGEMQSERDHRFEGVNTETGEFMGRKWRHATDGGWFLFGLKIDPKVPMDLICTYWGGDSGNREFDILVSSERIAAEVLENNRPGVFYDKTYELPTEITTGRDGIYVRFQAHPGKMAGGLYGCRAVRRATPVMSSPR
ncbi:MAG TPA: beta-L-arabinofuranosidase domain-containing protein [Armatimonadota bacterium]